MPLKANSWMWIYIIFCIGSDSGSSYEFYLGVCMAYGNRCTFIVIYYFPCSFMCWRFYWSGSNSTHTQFEEKEEVKITFQIRQKCFRLSSEYIVPPSCSIHSNVQHHMFFVGGGAQTNMGKREKLFKLALKICKDLNIEAFEIHDENVCRVKRRCRFLVCQITRTNPTNNQMEFESIFQAFAK